jgi:hypothetical protein
VLTEIDTKQGGGEGDKAAHKGLDGLPAALIRKVGQPTALLMLCLTMLQ